MRCFIWYSFLQNFYPRPPRGGRPDGGIWKLEAKKFLSTPSARRATASSSSCTASSRFLSTPSARRATSSWSPCGGRWRNFYPRPPRGGRRSLLCSFLSVTLFLSTPSARRATEPYPGIDQNLQDFYPRPPRGGRPRQAPGCRRIATDFYPRPPRGGRPSPSGQGEVTRIFLSTPSARRATCADVAIALGDGDFYPRPPRGGRPTTPSSTRPACDFYPRPPRGGRPMYHVPGVRHFLISIHALREEGDGSTTSTSGAFTIFLSTPSARRATCNLSLGLCSASTISIHALREEGDAELYRCRPAGEDFYPRPPRGGRPSLPA